MAGKPKMGGRRRRAVGFSFVSLVIEALFLHRRTGKLAGSIPVRCHSGHLFTTIWIPGVSLKALRLGPWRVQRCPVGRHWSVVTPAAGLTRRQRRTASATKDLRIP
jgi:hypothetical protein